MFYIPFTATVAKQVNLLIAYLAYIPFAQAITDSGRRSNVQQFVNFKVPAICPMHD
ncbi:hypothetical protein SPSPH_045060 [Sporomusa sphaeroides DSM 2875]|uniref:Uncharacterized protein n=1 Tax=Sporomusa sphaeroides DSM 2875 TaxID=1337886 RepID=A0ABM9W0N3_9FIRM|nr:hypothetical protein SPSPH_27320 [Sporomusa sphaeroides DSM 2875]CVK18434.1 hypothetical protein SSPH_01072 [Sporomusa sphaeroides DSM 2875]